MHAAPTSNKIGIAEMLHRLFFMLHGDQICHTILDSVLISSLGVGDSPIHVHFSTIPCGLAAEAIASQGQRQADLIAHN